MKILQQNRFDSSRKQNSYVAKSPEIHLFVQFHMTITVHESSVGVESNRNEQISNLFSLSFSN